MVHEPGIITAFCCIVEERETEIWKPECSAIVGRLVDDRVPQ
jgi:hypothetical protein